MMLCVTYKGRMRTLEDARRFWHVHNRMQRTIEKHFVPKLKAAIVEQFKSFIKVIEQRGYEYAKRNIFTLVEFGGIAKVIKELYLKSAYIESNYVINYLRHKRKNADGKVSYKLFRFERKRLKPGKLGLGFDDLAPVIDQYFQIYLLNNSALPITATTRRIIVKHLLDAVDSGKPLAKAISDFKELALTGGSVYSLGRAVKIARTESTTALSFGGLIGAYMTGIDVEKVWVTSDDERVRGWPNYKAKYPHTDLDLNSVDMKGSFYNGEPIRFPGDPEASIENIGNCRCAQYFREKQEPDEEIEDRRISNFLIDMFSGLLSGVGLVQLIEGDNDTSEN